MNDLINTLTTEAYKLPNQQKAAVLKEIKTLVKEELENEIAWVRLMELVSKYGHTN